MNRCFIVTPNSDIDLSVKSSRITDEDCILCADGGLRDALSHSLPVTAVIGDFDSMDLPNQEDVSYEIIRYPVKKDDTDTLLCLKHALSLGYRNITILGGVGSRLDHVFANIQLLKYAAVNGASCHIVNDRICVYYLKNGTMEFREKCKYLSVFSLSEESRGVTVKGADYPLENAILVNSLSLGVSNTYQDKAQVSVSDGELLIMLIKSE